MAVVSGRLQIRPWEDKDGNKRRSAEVVAESIYFGDSKKDGQNSSYGDYPAQYDNPAAGFTELDDDEDLPF